MNKSAIKGSLYALAGFVLAMVEALTHKPPRIELIVGYALVFVFGIFIVATRQLREHTHTNTENRSKEQNGN